MKDYLCKLLDILILKLSWNNWKTSEVPFEKFEKTKYTFSIIHLVRVSLIKSHKIPNQIGIRQAVVVENVA